MNKTVSKSISVIFPAYNEEANIKNTVLSAQKVLERMAVEYEIIVANDGSKDGTAAVLTDLVKEVPKLRVVIHQKNQGYGKTVWDGLMAAKKDLVFFADSDGQFDLDGLPKFVAAFKEGNAVLGYRQKRQDSFVRLVNAYLWKCLIRLLFRLKVKDIDCAYKVFARDDIQSLKINSFGAMCSAEILIRLQDKGIDFVQLPVAHKPRLAGKSTGANIKVILRSFRELYRFYVDYQKEC